MSRSLQDQFIDDDQEEEACPLCVEEFDLTDRGFRPCPCGYQICQFCYHNVKTNMNGLCPACRRAYNDNDIEYKVITPEETAAYKARQAQKQKKTQAALQKEKQKAEADHLSRKHLAGMRVVQKNLVYVTGLSPTSQEDQLLQTLRGDQYFGQYGKIIKIVVSKAKDPSHPHSVGVYVTYERKEDAASCIAAVDGSKNGERTLRAQFGTTKYCSAYLRGENCSNRNCMFLHEPGEANESYSRADLSSLNANSSQLGTGRAPPPQSQQPVASASQPMARQGSNDQPSSPIADRPALPSTASWASKPPQPSRAESRSTSGTLESPAPVVATPAQPTPEVVQEDESTSAPPPEAPSPVAKQSSPKQHTRAQIAPFLAVLKDLNVDSFKLVWSLACLSETERNIINNYPPLFDNNGSTRMRLRRQREDEQRRLERDVQAQTLQQPPVVEHDDNPEMSGSLQLGGEPEERQSLSQVQSAIHPPGQDGALDQRFQMGGTVSSPVASDRVLTPQQHQQMLLQTLKPNTPGAYVSNNDQRSTGFQTSYQQQGNPPLGHQRNVSRYSFANDSSSASAAVKPVANPKLMNQQSSMMPPAGGNHFGAQHQQPHGQFYTSNVQGPPPGLKTTGTPPVSGNLTFGQGHGFATGGLQYGTGATRSQQDNYYRDLLRGRDAAAGVDAKRELHSFPNYNNTHPGAAYPSNQSNAFSAPPYASLGTFGDGEKQRKKKGKKHRHATTSSSSGGGLVDIAAEHNNHLLQARLHQGGGLGGGAFAGQQGAAGGLYSVMHGGGYDDADFPPLAPSRQHSISLAESRKSTPPVPPGFESHVANESRRSTPTVPPGLTKPTGLPDLEGSSRPASRASLKRTSSHITPALPLRPGTPSASAAVPTPSRKEIDTEAIVQTPTRPSRTAASQVRDDLTHQEGTPTSNDQASEQLPAAEAISDEALDKGAETTSEKSPPNFPSTVTSSTSNAPASIQPATKGKATVQTSESKAVLESSSIADVGILNKQNRKHPGKLDITAAVSQKEQQPPASSTATPVDNATSSKAARASSQTAPLTRLPESPAVSSPAVKTARTLRVVQTPKAETPPAAAFPSLPSVAAHKLPSRQPSVASITLPGTPSSEHVSMSDNISMTSTSQSRANSPPPTGSKVGAAPVRTKTKSQMKKERQERAKALEEEKVKTEEVVKPVTEESTHEAIVSRKKKTKKEKEPRPAKPKAAADVTADTTPTASRPVSPGNRSAAETPPKVDMPAAIPRESKPATPTKSTPTPPPSQPHVQPPTEPSPPPTPTAAQIIADLKASAPEIQRCIDSLFRLSNNNSHFKAPQNVPQKDLLNTWNPSDAKNIHLTKDEINALLTGKVPAIHRSDHPFDRHMITPSGAHLRALTKELESRFLELEKALREMPEDLHFRPSKPQNEMKLPSVDLEALRRTFEDRATGGGGRGVNVMEQMGVEGSGMRKGGFLVDEAGRYVDEFVMPRVGTPTTMANGSGAGANGQQQRAEDVVQGPVSVDIAERRVGEARRMAEEREGQLRKVVKRNKKVAGWN